MAKTYHTDQLPEVGFRLQPGDCVWYNDGTVVFTNERGHMVRPFNRKFALDLSPLQKFMGRRRYPHNGHITIQGDDDYYRCTRCHGRVGLEYRVEDRCSGVIGMYGMDYDFDWVPPAPSPEKSPQEKALDDFIAKRKAKREGAGVFGGIGRDAEDAEMRRAIKEEADGRILDRAMRRLSFHEQDIHTRLMPYRREEK